MTQIVFFFFQIIFVDGRHLSVPFFSSSSESWVGWRWVASTGNFFFLSPVWQLKSWAHRIVLIHFFPRHVTEQQLCPGFRPRSSLWETFTPVPGLYPAWYVLISDPYVNLQMSKIHQPALGLVKHLCFLPSFRKFRFSLHSRIPLTSWVTRSWRLPTER